MRIEVKGQWHESEAFADEDRKYFKFLFGLKHSSGKESVRLTDRREYRATCSVDTDDYEIEKK